LGDFGSFIEDKVDKKKKRKDMLERLGVFKRLPIDPMDYLHYTPEI
jgi:hypothetical protein